MVDIVDFHSMTIGEAVEFLVETGEEMTEMAWTTEDGPVYVVLTIGDAADLVRAILDDALGDGEGDV